MPLTRTSTTVEGIHTTLYPHSVDDHLLKMMENESAVRRIERCSRRFRRRALKKVLPLLQEATLS